MGRKLSYEIMKQADSVMVLGAGPSLDLVIKKVINWQKKHNALVIGVHYAYKIKSDYTLFLTPLKFKNSQGKAAGQYIVGPRIRSALIKRKIRKGILRPRYGEEFLKWSTYDFLSRNEILQSKCGIEAIMIGCLCRPSNLLIVGFDGFEVVNDKLVVRHSIKSSSSKKAFIKFLSKRQKKRDLGLDELRRKKLYELIQYLTDKKKINLHIFQKDRIKGLDKKLLAGNKRVEII